MTEQFTSNSFGDQSEIVEAVAKRTGLTVEAVSVLLTALQSGGGKMAQFNHSQLGGMGQWSSGMLMIGEFNNAALKAKVQEACEQLSSAIVQGSSRSESTSSSFSSFKFPEAWWDSALGTPAARGGQNEIQYAYFPSLRRLAVKHNSTITTYDTGDHEIYGVAQQQGDGNSLVFESQHGRLESKDLRVIP